MRRATTIFASVTLLALASLTGATRTTAAIHNVIVGDNFFSPAVLTVEVGDTVRWTNSAGIHNVYSCTATQIGCGERVANESFDNGPPRTGLWVYSYTFTLPGSNPYLCQSHATFMKGEIVVQPPVGAPPPVPDGAIGPPMTVSRPPSAGESMTIGWDTESCGAAVGYRLLHGTRDSFPGDEFETYEPAGGVCDVFPPFTWVGEPSSPGELVWWVIVADDGDQTEGSWGTGVFGERRGPLEGGASGACGAVAKVVSDCAP